MSSVSLRHVFGFWVTPLHRESYSFMILKVVVLFLCVSMEQIRSLMFHNVVTPALGVCLCVSVCVTLDMQTSNSLSDME